MKKHLELYAHMAYKRDMETFFVIYYRHRDSGRLCRFALACDAFTPEECYAQATAIASEGHMVRGTELEGM